MCGSSFPIWDISVIGLRDAFFNDFSSPGNRYHMWIGPKVCSGFSAHNTLWKGPTLQFTSCLSNQRIRMATRLLGTYCLSILEAVLVFSVFYFLAFVHGGNTLGTAFILGIKGFFLYLLFGRFAVLMDLATDTELERCIMTHQYIIFQSLWDINWHWTVP